MSNSKLAEKFIKATHFSSGRSGRKIETITIHHMAGVLTAEQCGRIFQGNRQASAHYGVGSDGRIAQYVDEADTAWSNSNWDSNCKSVTIETSNSSAGGNWPVSDTVLNSLIRLVADVAKRNNITLVRGKTLVWHSMFASTACPGTYLLSKMDYIIDEANKINAVPEQPEQTKPSQNKTNEEIANEVIAGKWGNGADRKTKLTNVGYDYNEIQNIVNKKLLGNKTEPKPSKSIDELAKEVIRGDWGNGADRKTRLINAGYDYNAVQKRVNEILM